MNRIIQWFRLRRRTVEDRIMDALRNGYRHGVPIMRAYGISSGALYPTLMRLETQGVIVSSWDESSVPRRRAYDVTFAIDEQAREVHKRIAEKYDGVFRRLADS